MSVFAGVWGIVGVWAVRPSLPWYGIPVLLTVLMLVAAPRRGAVVVPPTDEEAAHVDRLVGVASAVEGVLILVAVNVLRNVGRADWVGPVVAIIVGLHFFPLARWLPARLYYATGLLLVAIGIGGFGIQDGSQRLAAVSLSAAGVLWLTSAVILFAPSGR